MSDTAQMWIYKGPSGSLWYSTDQMRWYASPEAAQLAIKDQEGTS